MQRRKNFLLNGLMMIWLTLTTPIVAAHASSLIIDSQQQYQFAQQLFDEGQFRRAAEEFERFAFFFPLDPQHRVALFNAGRSFLSAGDGLAALRRFNALMAQDEMDSVAVNANFMAVECHLLLGDPNQAILRLHNLIALTPDTDIKDRARLRIGWILIAQLDWSGARRAFERMTPQGREEQGIKAIVMDLEQADHLSRKSPTLAGTLSIIPGAGQLYCGRYEDALAALIVNGGLFWAAYESFDNDLNVLGGMIAFVGFGFYAGNIYSAVSAAHKYNRKEQLNFVDQLKRHLSINIEPQGSSLNGRPMAAIAVQWHFKF